MCYWYSELVETVYVEIVLVRYLYVELNELVLH